VDQHRRPLPVRIGLVLLNVLAPGLGLLRLGSCRAALPWLIAPTVAILALTLVLWTIPQPSFRMFVALVAIILPVSVALLLVPAVMTWRGSRARATGRPWWSRWYSLVVVAILVSISSQLAGGALHRLYKPFYAPSESMVPTILKNDKLVADMRGGRKPVRGDVVLFEAGGLLRLGRVVGLPDDRVAMRDGVPVVNGLKADQRRAGSLQVLGFDGPGVATRLEERLLGEVGSHFVLDEGYNPSMDEMEERKVPPGHMFVLGDNRDRSADSRVPASAMGVEMVPMSAVRGRPLYIHWSADRSRIGTAINGRPGR
jgi:signal peptidase I